MEVVVEVERNDEESGVEKISSSLSSPKSIADPVVYKLVRVHYPFDHINFLCAFAVPAPLLNEKTLCPQG